MKMFWQFAAVACGGVVGSVTRFAISLLFTWSAFPIGTLLINLSGSLFLGWFLTVVNDRVITVSDPIRVGIGVGFVGAYTTFSTYMFESDKMLQDGLGLRSLAYIVMSVVLGLLAVRSGVLLGRWH